MDGMIRAEFKNEHGHVVGTVYSDNEALLIHIEDLLMGSTPGVNVVNEDVPELHSVSVWDENGVYVMHKSSFFAHASNDNDEN